jgi:trigger factor
MNRIEKLERLFNLKHRHISRWIALLFCGMLVLTSFSGCSFGYSKTELTGKSSQWKEDEPYQSYKLDKYIKLGAYKGIKVDLEKEEVSDEAVANAAKEYFTQTPLGVEQTAGKDTIANGDTVEFNFEGKAPGLSAETLANMKASNYSLVIGSGSFIPGFEEQMVGQKINTTFDVQVTFPDPYTNDSSLSGKAVTFTCTVHKIGSSAITDAAVVTLTSGQIANVKDFLAYVKDELLYEKEDANMQTAFEAAFANAKVSAIPAPEQKYYEDLLVTQAKMNNMSTTEFLTANGITESYKDYKKNTVDENIKRDLFCFAIAEKENIEITQSDITASIADGRNYNAEFQGKTDAEIIEMNGGKGMLIRALMADQVRQFIYDNAVKTFK